MKKVALFFQLVIMLYSVSVVSADPQNRANLYVVANVTCDDDYNEQVLVPAAPATQSFYRPIDKG